MDLEHIPKSFWHAVSFSLVVFTLGFLYIAHEAKGISLTFNDLTVKTKDIDRQSEQLNIEWAQLEKMNQQYQQNIQQLEAQLAQLRQQKSATVDFTQVSRLLAQHQQLSEQQATALTQQKSRLDFYEQQQKQLLPSLEELQKQKEAFEQR